jgi:hypothetical protein
MVKRVWAGVLGGVAGILPLLLVNLAVNAGGALGGVEAFAAQDALALGILALLGGVALGGGLAGWLAGRAGGTAAAGLSGALAAALYAVTVILLLVGGAKQGWGPPVAAIHPIRVSAAIILVACLLLGVALIAGALASRGGMVAPADPPAAPMRRSPPAPRPAAPYRSARDGRPNPGPNYGLPYGSRQRPDFGQDFGQDAGPDYGEPASRSRPIGTRPYGGYDRAGDPRAPAPPTRPRPPDGSAPRPARTPPARERW